MPKLVRITTVPISLNLLITGQMKYMRDNGYEVIMMSADGPEIKELVEREKCPHEIVPLTRQITPFKDLKALWILYRKLKRIKPQIIHSHTPKAGLIGMMAAWLARVPIRLHTVAGLPLEATSGGKKKLLLFIEWLTYKCATEVWPNSKSLYTFIDAHKLAKRDKLRIIGRGSSNGIDTSEFDTQKLDGEILASIKSDINYASQNKYLLFVGRIVKDKGIEELVDAFQKLKERHSNLKLILVGPFESQLDPLSADTLTAIEDDVDIITTGFSTKVKYFMDIADIFVFPSHREGFPNVPMQAGLMKCPVVASKITGNVDIIDHEINGLLHKKGSANDIFEKVDFALSNSDQMDKMTDALEEKIKEHFDRIKIQKFIFDVYNFHLKSKDLLPQ